MAAVNSKIINGISPTAYTQAQIGDIAITSDNTFWILVNTPTSVASNWKKLDIDSTDDGGGGATEFELTIPAAQVANWGVVKTELLPALAANQYYDIIGFPTIIRKAGTVAYNFGFDGLLGMGFFPSSLNLATPQWAFQPQWINSGGSIPATQNDVIGMTRGDTYNSIIGRNIEVGYYDSYGGGSPNPTQGDSDVVIRFSYNIKTIPA